MPLPDQIESLLLQATFSEFVHATSVCAARRAEQFGEIGNRKLSEVWERFADDLEGLAKLMEDIDEVPETSGGHSDQYVVAHRQFDHGGLGLYFFTERAKAEKCALRLVEAELDHFDDDQAELAAAIQSGDANLALLIYHEPEWQTDSIEIRPIVVWDPETP